MDDTISRSAALDAMETWDKFGCDPDGKLVRYDDDKHYIPYVHYEDMVHAIKHLPSTQPGWIYIEEALPKTIINKHTHDYQEYNCLCDFGEYGFDVRTYKFGYGHFWNGGGIVDKYVTAWQPLPEIPDALKPKPWEGEKP